MDWTSGTTTLAVADYGIASLAVRQAGTPDTFKQLPVSQILTRDAAGRFQGVAFHSPNSSTTGAIIIRDAVGNPGAAYLQFTNYDGSNEFSWLRGFAGGIQFGGAVLLGTSALISAEKLGVSATGDTNAAALKNAQATRPTVLAWNAATSGDNLFVQFFTEASATARGSIGFNRGSGVVAYNTTSDYRAKDVIGAIEDAGSTIDALAPVMAKMKGASVARPMFIAHELAEHCPYAVTGEKDAVDAADAPVMQQVDASVLVPLLVAEIKALRARVAALETA